MARVFRFIWRFLAVLFALAIVFVITLFVYYFVTRLDSSRFLAKDARVLLRVKSVNRLLEDMEQSRLASFITQYPGMGKLLANLKRVRGGDGALVRHLMPLMDSPLLITVDAAQRPLVIVDLGAKSLLFSGGIFAAKSFYQGNPDISLTYEEFNTSKHTLNIYQIMLLKENLSLRVAMVGNLLLLAEEREPVVRALQANEQGRTLDSLPEYKKVARSLAAENLQIIGEPQGILRWLRDMDPQVRYILNRFRFFSYFGLSARLEPEATRLRGLITTSLGRSLTNRKLERMFAANQYEPHAFRLMPKSFAFAASLLFDDLEELYDQLRLLLSGMPGIGKTLFDLQKTIKEKTGMTIKQLLFDWSGHELGAWHNGKESLLFLQVIDPTRAMRAMERLKKSGFFVSPAAEKHRTTNIYQIRMPFYLAFLASIFVPDLKMPWYGIVDRYMVFSQEKETLIRLIDNRFSRNTFDRSEAFRNMRSRFPLRSNLMLIWNSGHPALTFAGQPNLISRILTSQKFGLITMTLQDKALKFRVNLFD